MDSFIEKIKTSKISELETIIENSKNLNSNDCIFILQREFLCYDYLSNSDFEYLIDDREKALKNWKIWINCKKALYYLGHTNAQNDIDDAIAYKKEISETCQYSLHLLHNYEENYKEMLVFYYSQLALVDIEERNDLRT